MILTVEERRHLANDLTNILEETFNDKYESLLAEIQDYKKEVSKSSPKVKRLVELLEQSILIEDKLKALTDQYKTVKQEVVEILTDVDGTRYIYPELWLTKYSIFDTKLINEYINEVLNDKVKEEYGDVLFDKIAIKKKVLSLIHRLMKDYHNSDSLVRRVLFEAKEYLRIESKIKKERNEQ